MKVTLDKAAQLITALMHANVPVNLIGSPGVGKSDVIKQVAESMDLKVIDFRLSTADPTDLSGLPFMHNGRSTYLPNEAFPLETDPLPTYKDSAGIEHTYKGWLLFLDEISNAPMSVQAAAYKLILDREVGMHKLHHRVAIVSAGNKTDDLAAVTGEMSTALKSRMAHFEIQVSVDVWLEWALKNNVDHSITSFIKFKPTALYMFDPTLDALTFPCPRTWGMLNRTIDTVGINSPMLVQLATAILSEGTAREYVNFCKNFANLPTFADIIKDPANTPVPEELSTRFALSGSIGAQTNKSNVDKVMEYVARMPAEFQLRTFHDFVRREPALVTVPAVRTWVQANAKHLAR